MTGSTQGVRSRCVTVEYACGCHMGFRYAIPLPGDTICCRRHGETIVLAPHGYFIKCRSCRYSRGTGEDKLQALHLVANHLAKNPCHSMEARYDNHLIYRSVMGAQLELEI